MVPIKNIITIGKVTLCGICRQPHANVSSAARCLSRCSIRYLNGSFRPPSIKKGRHVCHFCSREYQSIREAERCVDDCRIDWERSFFEVISLMGFSGYYQRLKHENVINHAFEKALICNNRHLGTKQGSKQESLKADVLISIEMLNDTSDAKGKETRPQINDEEDAWGELGDLVDFESTYSDVNGSNDKGDVTGKTPGKLRFKKIGEAKWVRAGSKYKCSLCKNALFTKSEAEACYDAH